MGNIEFFNSLRNIKDTNALTCKNINNEQVTLGKSLEITGLRVYYEPHTNREHDSKDMCRTEVFTKDQKVKLIPVSNDEDMLQIRFLLDDLDKGYTCNGFQGEMYEQINDHLSGDKSKVHENEPYCYQQNLLEQLKDVINCNDRIGHSQLCKLGKKESDDKSSFGNIGDAYNNLSVSTETDSLMTSSMATQTCLKETKNFKVQTEPGEALDSDIHLSSFNGLPMKSCTQTEICQKSEIDSIESCEAELYTRRSLIVSENAADSQQATTSVNIKNLSNRSKQEYKEKSTLTDYELNTTLNCAENKVVNLKNKEPKIAPSHSKEPAILAFRSFRRIHPSIFPCRFYKHPTLHKRKSNIKSIKRNRSLIFRSKNLESTNAKSSFLNPALTIDDRNRSPIKRFLTDSLIHAECMRNTSIAERVTPLGMIKFVPECTIKSLNLMRSYPFTLTVNPVCLKFLEYPTPTTEERDIEYTRSVNCLKSPAYAEDGSVPCKELQKNAADESVPWDENTVSDSAYTEDIENTFGTVVFCQKSQSLADTKHNVMVSLCDDCFSKTWLAANEYLAMESSSLISECSEKEPSFTEQRSVSNARTHQFECRSSDTILDTGERSLSAESPVENLRPFCEAVNNHLLSLSHEDEDLLKEYISILNQRWLTVVKNKYLKSKEVYAYLQYFQMFSDELVNLVMNFTDSEDNNALHYAFGNNRFDTVEEILCSKHGSDLLIKKNKLGHTPLMICASSQPKSDEDWIIVKKSFKLGNINEVSSHCGRTALMSAASLGSSAMVRVLLDCGADPNLQDNEGSTALMYATEHGCKECVTLLLQHPECDPLLKDQDGQTALSIAKATDQKDIAKQIHLSTMKMPSNARRQQALKTPKSRIPLKY